MYLLKSEIILLRVRRRLRGAVICFRGTAWRGVLWLGDGGLLSVKCGRNCGIFESVGWFWEGGRSRKLRTAITSRSDLISNAEFDCGEEGSLPPTCTFS